MNIAILGFGTVGSGVYELCKNSNLCINVLKILDLPKNKDKNELITSNIEDIIYDDNIDLVVETIGGINPSYEYITLALKNKKHVVSANKAVIAKYFKEFYELAKKNNVKFLCEASVGGGIYWIDSILKAKRIDEIKRIYGIFNGTSNFILDKMYKENLNFDEILKEAQSLGYAEANPSADIDGFDVKNKIIISSNYGYSAFVNDEFLMLPLRNISLDDILYFKTKNKIIKYIGESKITDKGFEAIVIPTLFDNDRIEANIELNYNIITLFGESIGNLKFYGQGAGKFPTANAIIQDILDISTNKEYEFIANKDLEYDGDTNTYNFVIRINNNEKISEKVFEKIEKTDKYYYLYTYKITLNEFSKLYLNLYNELFDNKDVFVCKIFEE